ncbi:hypothetical protein V6N13_088041 [Hibiscus sabdariffa]
MHWKGLLTTFAHHGDVLDSFIPQNKSKSGKRFGFIRFATRADAARAITRLNGFMLFGFRVSVSYARFNDRTKYWRKVHLTKEKSRIEQGGNEEDCRSTAKVAVSTGKNKGTCWKRTSFSD